MPEDKGLFFEATDPRGYRISLSKSRYYNHITSSVGHIAHTEFTPDEIRECVEKPEIVWQSESVPTSDLYFGRTSSTYPTLFLRTAVAVDDKTRTGEVMTAHLTKKVSGGKDGGVRYVNYKSKL